MSAPLYTRAFFTACGLHFVGALSLAMWFLLPLYVQHLGGSDAAIGLLLGVATARPESGDRRSQGLMP